MGYIGARERTKSFQVTKPLFAVDVVDVDGAEREGDVDDDEDEEEDHHVQDHVGHADDDGTRLAPHQANLQNDHFSML